MHHRFLRIFDEQKDEISSLKRRIGGVETAVDIGISGDPTSKLKQLVINEELAEEVTNFKKNLAAT